MTDDRSGAHTSELSEPALMDGPTVDANDVTGGTIIVPPAAPKMPPPENLDHLTLAIRALLAEPNSKRIQYILTDRLIVYRDLKEILNRVHWLVQEPRGSRARGEIYVGGPGSGKSSISMIVQKAYPLNAREINGVQPPKVIAISISGARTTKAVLNRILTALGVPTANRTIGDLEQVVIDTLLRANVRLIIIDELQDLRQLRESEQLRVLETLKHLMNQVRLSVLGLGDVPAKQAFDADPHIRARFSVFSIPQWSEGDGFAEFLKAIEKNIPLKNRSDLARPEIQKALLKCSGGVLDTMLRRIKAAAVQAIVDGSEQIKKEMLEIDLPRPPIENLKP